MKKLERDWGAIHPDVLWLVWKSVSWKNRVQLSSVCRSWRSALHQNFMGFLWKKHNCSNTELLTFWDPASKEWVKLDVALLPAKVSSASNGLVPLVKQGRLSVVNLVGEVIYSSSLPQHPPVKRFLSNRGTRVSSSFLLRDEKTGRRFAVLYTTFKEDSFTRWLVVDVYDLWTSEWSRHQHWYETFVRAKTPGVTVKECALVFLVEGPEAQEFSIVTFDVKTKLWKVVSVCGSLKVFTPNLVVWNERLATVVEKEGGGDGDEGDETVGLEVKELDESDEENVRWIDVKTRDEEKVVEKVMSHGRKGKVMVVSDGCRIFVARLAPGNEQVVVYLDVLSKHWRPVVIEVEGLVCCSLKTCLNLSF